jgi:DnaJ-class molecular chaperone
VKTLYDVLGVARDVDAAGIKKAFRTLARTYHPDNRATGDRARFVEIEGAYQTLSDPARRAAYDSARDAAPSASKAGSPFLVNVAIPIPRSPEEIVDLVDRVVTDPKQAIRDAARANLTSKGARVVDALIELFKT